MSSGRIPRRRRSSGMRLSGPSTTRRRKIGWPISERPKRKKRFGRSWSPTSQAITDRKLEKKFVYDHEAVSDPAPFQYLLPLGSGSVEPISYYCVAGGSLGWSTPASLGIKLEGKGWQGIETSLVVNAVGDGSSLFYPQIWWTAAHRNLAVLYIIMNNHEYHTLQIGLRQVIQAYGSAPG